LIWGDNKLILSSLKNGPLREQIEVQGGLKLVYIDPPFDVGADFSMDIEIGGDTFTKKPNILEEIAYRDTWGKGADSFISMIYERLVLIRDLLADDGSVYVHCDWRVNAYMRLVLDEVFGTNCFANDIAWHYSGWNKKLNRGFEKRYDSIFLYSRTDQPTFNSYFDAWPSKEAYVKARKQKVRKDDDGREYVLSDAGGGTRIKRYLDEVMKEGVVVDDVWDLDKYERQHFVGLNPNLREEEQRKQVEQKEAAFLELILHAYRAEATDGFASFHGKKAGRLVAVGPVNLPITRLFVEEIILECRKKQISKVDILGFEFEMGLFPNVLEEARGKGIDIAPKYIPADVFDKRAVEKNQVVFHDVSFIEVKPHVVAGKKGEPATVAVELTDFSVFYSQDSIAQAEESLSKTKKAGSKIVVEKGQIVKISKDKNGVITRETLTDKWTDWIDYWSVDFDYESKREIVRVKKHWPGQGTLDVDADKQPDLDEWEEQWTGDYVFENEWQSFRTKKDRSLDLKSVAYQCAPGRRKIAVKVVDIFGNDTMAIVDVSI
jgi:hypothetical protein